MLGLVHEERRESAQESVFFDQQYPVFLGEIPFEHGGGDALEMSTEKAQHRGAVGHREIASTQQLAIHKSATSTCATRPSSRDAAQAPSARCTTWSRLAYSRARQQRRTTARNGCRSANPATTYA